MPKKNLLLVIFVLFSFSALGGTLFYNHSIQKQRNENMTKQNHIGDLRFQFKDFDEVTPPSNPSEVAKNEGGSDVASVPANSAPRAGSSEIKPSAQKQSASGESDPPSNPPEVAKNEGGSAVASAPANSAPQAESSEIKPSAQKQSASGESDPLRSQIEQKYISRLQSLASDYEGKLNNLVLTALSEYNAVKKNNPNADISPLINKYNYTGKALEAECDSKFYSILADFESELRAHSFPLDAAVRAKETYEARKSARAGQITSGKP